MKRASQTDALTDAKRALRARILALRDALDAKAREVMSATIASRLIRLPAYRTARVVAGYASFGSEWMTQPFLEDVLHAGKALLLPRIDRTLRGLVFHEVRDLDSDLVAGQWGIREPDPVRCPVADLKRLDFMLVPGVAFSAQGHRLGYGGGYYDRVLAALHDGTTTVAGAFSLQVVESVPVGPKDQSVHGVLTESEEYGAAVGSESRS